MANPSDVTNLTHSAAFQAQEQITQMSAYSCAVSGYTLSSAAMHNVNEAVRLLEATGKDNPTTVFAEQAMVHDGVERATACDTLNAAVPPAASRSGRGR